MSVIVRGQAPRHPSSDNRLTSLRSESLGAAVVAAVCAAALAAAGCSPQRSHIFGAHRYDPVGDCLEDATAVDVIEGPPPGECEPVRCWISPADEIYVTTACEAPPGYEDHTHDPEPSSCASALAAYAEGEEGRCPD